MKQASQETIGSNLVFLPDEDNSGPRIFGGGYYEEHFHLGSSVRGQNYIKFIKACETLIRKSDWYCSYLGYLHNEVGLTNCAFFSAADKDNVELEFHHYPLTLFDIVCIIVEKKLANKEPVTSMSVSYEVMEAHSNNLVGLVLLSISVHELFHAGKIKIAPYQVFGNIAGFVENYKDYFDTKVNLKLEQYNSITEPDFSNLKIEVRNFNLEKNPLKKIIE